MLLENTSYPEDIRVHREANALHAAGYRVSVICPCVPGQPLCDEVKGVHVYRYPAPTPAQSALGYVWEYGYSMTASFLLSILVFFTEGFNVIHAHNPPDTFVFIAAVYKLFGKRFVFDHHDLSPEMYQARFVGGGNALVFKTLILLEKLTCWLADHVIVTNESYKKMAIERCGVPASRITVVRNGLEVSRLNHGVEPDPEMRQMGKTIIAYVGIMGVQDGVDCLLRSLYHLIHDVGRTGFYCVLIGPGDAREGLIRKARDLQLDDYVRFTGRLVGNDLLRYLSAADICVDSAPSNPYNDRSTIFKLMDYMSVGKPIVVFDLPEHRFTAQDAAVYVANNDERAFARTLADLMDDPARRRSLGAVGIHRIKTKLAWEYSVPNLLSVYQTVLPAALSTAQPATRASEVSIPPPQRSVLSQTSSFGSLE